MPSLIPFPHVLPSVDCLSVSDWCCHDNRRVEVSILLRPAWFISFPAAPLCYVAVLFCVAEYLLSPAAVQSRVRAASCSGLNQINSHLALRVGSDTIMMFDAVVSLELL